MEEVEDAFLMEAAEATPCVLQARVAVAHVCRAMDQLPPLSLFSCVGERCAERFEDFLERDMSIREAFVPVGDAVWFDVLTVLGPSDQAREVLSDVVDRKV